MPNFKILTFILLVHFQGAFFEKSTQPLLAVREEILSENYVVRWEPNFEDETVVFSVTVGTKGFVGFGISPGGGMAGADLVIGGVFPNGTSYFGDWYAFAAASPTYDISQDWTLLTARENDTHTVLEFSRAFDTGDSVGDVVITDEDTHFIWSFGATDDARGYYHGPNRDFRAINILFEPSDPVPTSSATTIDPTSGTSIATSEAPTPPPFKEEILNDNYVVRWTIDTVERTVTFKVTVGTRGFVGFGISDGGGMTGADIFIGGVFPNGTGYFKDYHGFAPADPIVDDSQDWYLLNAFENGTHTELEFFRAFDTGDEDDTPITEDVTNFIWSFGVNDGAYYHGPNRGSREVYILDPTLSTTESPSPSFKEEQLNDNYIVRWSTDPTSKIALFQLTVGTTGFVGFGISDGGGMAGADLIMGGVFSNGTSYFGDYWAFAASAPIYDDSQDWHLLTSIENDTHTFLEFSRAFDTGDENDVPITESRTHFIWSFGLVDEAYYHGPNRGSRSVYIIDPPESSTTSVTEIPATSPGPCNPNPPKEEILADNYIVSWSADLDARTVQFKIVVGTTGFVGFGISGTGTMHGADMTIGGVHTSGAGYFDDYHGVGTTPVLDDSQDWRVVSFRENGTHTELEFSRAFDTGDADDFPITEGEAYFIWSYGSTDVIQYHGLSRGSRLVKIIDDSCPMG